MTRVKKPVGRITDATVFERGKNREVCVTIYPAGTLGFRLKGMKSEYYLQVSQLFMQAVQRHAQTEKPAKPVRRVRRGCL